MCMYLDAGICISMWIALGATRSTAGEKTISEKDAHRINRPGTYSSAIFGGAVGFGVRLETWSEEDV